MCEWGNTIAVYVTVPAALSHTGVARRTTKGVDACIAPLIQALSDLDIETRGSCCGHGRETGSIVFAEGALPITQTTKATLAYALDGLLRSSLPHEEQVRLANEFLSECLTNDTVLW